MAQSREKSKVFNDPDTKETILTGIKDSVLNTHIAFIDALTAYGKYSRADYVSEADRQKCVRLLRNLKEGSIPESEIKKICIQLIDTDPFNSVQSYYYIIETFGDSDKNIEAIAAYFYFDMKEYKQKLADIQYSQIDFESNDSLDEKISSLEKYCEHIGFNDFNRLQHLKTALQEYMKQSYILDGEKYVSSLAKKQALKEIAIINKGLNELGISLPAPTESKQYSFNDILTGKSLEDQSQTNTLSKTLDAAIKKQINWDGVQGLLIVITALKKEQLSSHHGKLLLETLQSAYEFTETKAREVDGKVYSSIAEANEVREKANKERAKAQAVFEAEKKEMLKYADVSDINAVSTSHIIETISSINLKTFESTNNQTLALLANRKIYWIDLLDRKEISEIDEADSSLAVDSKNAKLLKSHIEKLKSLNPSTDASTQHLRVCIYNREQAIVEASKNNKAMLFVLVFFVLPLVVGIFLKEPTAVESTATASDAAIDAEIAATQPAPTPQEPTQEQPVQNEPVVASPAAPNSELPFVGKRSFNFRGGTGTEMSITIEENGNTKLEDKGTQNSTVYYEGAFSNPLLLNNEKTGLLFKDGKVYVIDNGKVGVNCKGDGQECVSELYSTE